MFLPKSSLFLKEFLLFGSTLGLGLWATIRFFNSPSGQSVEQIGLTGFNIAVVIIGILIAAVIYRFAKVRGVLLRLFLATVMILGSQVIFALFISGIYNLVAAILLYLAVRISRNVFIFNVGIVMAIAGVGSTVGIGLDPLMGLFLLVFLSFYDIIAVYKTKHMVGLAKGMIESGAIFGYVIPSDWKNFGGRMEQAQARIGEDYMVLGSGDIGLPLLFVSSLVKNSVTSAIIVAVFSLAGLLVTHILFVTQRERRPMAALPPIATMTIVGYLITQLW